MALTPMMNQYFQIKDKYKDCIVFFRLGDFYEMFFDDAKVASKELELVLTGRDCGMEERAPMCGIPFHSANSYISKLISKGYKIAICEQVEDPAMAKGIVKRDVIKIITPGTYSDASYLNDDENNFILSIYHNDKNNMVGLSFADISTGEVYATSTLKDFSILNGEIGKYNPKEIIIMSSNNYKLEKEIKAKYQGIITVKPPGFFTEIDDSYFWEDKLYFNRNNVSIEIKYSCNGIINYIFETQKTALSNINVINIYDSEDYMIIDSNSRDNLELISNLRDKTKKGSLLWAIDKTNTAMGARQLKKWLEQPLKDKVKIQERLDSVEELINNLNDLQDLKESLVNIYDIERIIGKISSKNVNAKELIALKNSLGKIPKVKDQLGNFTSALLNNFHIEIDELKDIYDLLEKGISDNPSISLKEGNLIKDKFNKEVDEYRIIKISGKQWIANTENKERETTGIKSLKVKYNKVFGYFIEVTNSNLNLVPTGRYIRKQTLSNCERYITDELKEMEDKILGAEEKLIQLEYDIFVDIRDKIEEQIYRMQKTASILSKLDCLVSFALTAIENNFCKPQINSENNVEIKNGRHPVVEKVIPLGSFVSNDVYLDTDDNQLLLITGPNMAGKSTYMRQVALIVLLAHMGCYVPADSANICICDRIFTRIGASDDLSSGKSTFMVEMSEVSNILRNATNKSLVLLDEVGRGTSTYDGLSIAWSVIEYICNNSKLKCKTLFATHYHELTKLEGKVPGLKNFSVSVKEINDEVIFLRKIIPGGADQSYGIEVAKLAGLPDKVINNAKEILEKLENNDSSNYESAMTKTENNNNKPQQIDFGDVQRDKLIQTISDLDIMKMTPMDTMNTLYDIVNKAKSYTRR